MFANLLEVYEAVRACDKCKYCRTRTNTVFGEGNLHARLMFIGEGPGKVEDETGRPFVGPAGQLLDKMIAAIGMKREDVYICNVVKCRPPGNAVPLPECAQACLPYLRMQVRCIAPEEIVPTYHPSALLRDESKKRLAWEDFKVIRALLEEHEENNDAE